MSLLRIAGPVLIITLGLLAAGCSSPEEAEGRSERRGADRAVKVITEPVSFDFILQKFEAVGTARAQRSAEIFSETSGEVTSVGFTSGQFVNRGDVLVQLENRSERLNVRRAEVQVRDAEQLINRYERIDVPEAISESQIDEARTALEAARIDLELAEDELSDRQVLAPFSGYVGLTEIDPGARLTEQTLITRLDDRERLFIDFDAPEQVFGTLGAGDTLTIEPFSLASGPVSVIIDVVDSGIEAQTRSFTVRAILDNQNDLYRPGMSFRVGFEREGERLPILPEAALLYGGDGAYIWTVEAERAVRTPVDVASRIAGNVLVRGRLSENTLVIVEGVQKVREGSFIEPSKADRTTSPQNSRRAPSKAESISQ
ncbi:MAG: efflux RND transporter periplasmic adaptor subunit [Pseudomonadota bacterium]